jgi:hypothetical protein
VDIPNPGDLARRFITPPARPTASTDGHHQALRGFAFFALHRPGEVIDDPFERGRVAWADTLDGLAVLAEKEDWTGYGESDLHLPILSSHLRYTYHRLVMEAKIATSADDE